MKARMMLTVIGGKGLEEIGNRINHILEVITQWSAFVESFCDRIDHQGK